MDTERRLIALPDGRQIDLLLAGPPGGLPLVMNEGTPIGLVLYPPTVQHVTAATINRGARINHNDLGTYHVKRAEKGYPRARGPSAEVSIA